MPKTISDLKAAMLRAEIQGCTDDDEEEKRIKLAAAKRISDALQDAMAKECEDKTLSSAEAIRVLAVCLGAAIEANRSGGPLSGMIVAMKMFEIVINIATQE